MQVIWSDNNNIYKNWIVYVKVNVQKPGIYIPFAVTCNASRTL
jgi:hypothetical protein